MPACTSVRAGVQSTADLVMDAPSSKRKLKLIDVSAELEMTVNMLIQIDKLVQLLESPVFTCTSPSHSYSFPPSKNRLIRIGRPPSPTPRAGKVPPSLQMPLRPPDAPPPVLRLRGAEEPSEQRQRHRLSPHRPASVRVLLLPIPCPAEKH